MISLFFCVFISLFPFAWGSSGNMLYSKVNQNKIVHPPASETIQSLHRKLTLNHQDKDFTSAIQALIDRVLKRAGVKFSWTPTLEMIDYANEDGQLFDVFEIEGNSVTNEIILRGSSGVALSTAFGYYLRYYTNCDFHWEDGGGYSFASFPTTLEALPVPAAKERIVFLSKWRYYQNTCTASYSFVWKNWEQWEADIDWMAMNGFNLPLAFTGQELVWQKLWRQYGVSEAGLEQYFTGPAFLTWQRMANIRAFAGPLSDSWINQQAALQKQILSRYAELGMTPVLPAFNGVVPEEISTLFPTANITRLPSWNNFPEDYSCNYVLSPTDPLFLEIGTAFLTLQFEVFGPFAKSHLYNCDTFNENRPASDSFDYLSSASAAVYSSMIAADPEAVWIMQGWLFVNDTRFWNEENIHSYLAGVPDDGLIVLDLTAEDLPIWQKVAVNHKAFLWCMLHNYGGSRALYGNLTLIATEPIQVQREVPELFLGTGLTMEAIDQNPVIYELMAEMGFRRISPNVSQWIEQYATRRYSLTAETVSSEQKERAISAWHGLLQNHYQGEEPVCHHPCFRRSILTLAPSWHMDQANRLDASPLVDVWTALLFCQLSNRHRAYLYDLVDVSRQVMTNLFYDYYSFAQSAYRHHDITSFQEILPAMLQLIEDWDKLLSSHEAYLLGRWIAAARRWAQEKDETEANLLEFNARNQITLWGNNGEIDDYAAKNWGGLAKGYYWKRWQLLLSSTLLALKNHEPLDMEDYQAEELRLGQEFSQDTKTSYPTTAQGDAWEISREMHEKYGNGYTASSRYLAKRNQTVRGKNLLIRPVYTRNEKQLQLLCELLSSACRGFTTEGWLKTDVSKLLEEEGVITFVKEREL